MAYDVTAGQHFLTHYKRITMPSPRFSAIWLPAISRPPLMTGKFGPHCSCPCL